MMLKGCRKVKFGKEPTLGSVRTNQPPGPEGPDQTSQSGDDISSSKTHYGKQKVEKILGRWTGVL